MHRRTCPHAVLNVLRFSVIGKGAGAQAGEVAMQPVAQSVELKGLKIHLGPELRAMFPVVLNMSISGDIELNGAADPASLKLAGIIHLDGGEVCFIPSCITANSALNRHLNPE